MPLDAFDEVSVFLRRWHENFLKMELQTRLKVENGEIYLFRWLNELEKHIKQSGGVRSLIPSIYPMLTYWIMRRKALRMSRLTFWKLW